MSHDPSDELEQLRVRVRQLEQENDRCRRQLAETASLSHQLVDSCLEGVIVHQDNRIRYANAAAALMFGYAAPRELLDLPFWETLIDQGDWPVLQERTRRIQQRETVPLSPVFRGRRPDGQPLALQARGTLISWSGQPAVLAIYLDVTERQQAAQALQASQERLRTIVEEIPVLIDAFDLDGRVVLWNRECARVTGYEAAEVLGRTDTLALLYPDPAYRAEMLAHWKNSGPEYRDQEWTLTHKDGSKRTVAWSNIAGQVPIPGWGTWAVGVEVTKRRQAENALRANEERVRSLLQMIPHGISEIDVAGRFLYTNAAHDHMYGYEPGALIGHSIYETYVGPQTHAELAGRLRKLVREQPQPDFYPCQGRKRDGTIIDLEAIWDYRRDDAGNVIGFIAVVTDVTARKRAEEDQKRLDERLRETQKLESLGVLAGGIAHDFNNLLMSILGNAELARHHLGTGQPRTPGDGLLAASSLDQIEKASMRAAELCQQMLAYAGRGQFKVTSVDLGQIVQETAELLRLTISKKVTLRLEVRPGLPLVRADATQLRQVVLNLLLNASEAIGDRLGRIVVRLGMEPMPRTALEATLFGDGLSEGPYLCLEVRDSGSGMSEEVRGRIFEPFFTTKAAGRGLGLSAVVGIVRGHQGTMSLETTPGQGTTFRLYLPPSEELRSREVGVKVPESSWKGHGTVLVADDEPGMRQVTRALLEMFGFSVITVDDGLGAVEAFRREPERYRFVVLDLTMPRLDGRQALAELTAIRPEVAAILMSGYNERDCCADACLAGRVEFLQKPFRHDELKARVRALLGD